MTYVLNSRDHVPPILLECMIACVCITMVVAHFCFLIFMVMGSIGFILGVKQPP